MTTGRSKTDYLGLHCNALPNENNVEVKKMPKGRGANSY